jgi:hypothetical protein
VCEADATIAWVSETVELLLGHRPCDLVGTRLQDLYACEDRAYSEQGFAIIRAQPHVDPLEFRFIPRTAMVRHADGHYVTVESHATPCLSAPGINAILIEWHLVADRRRLLRAIDTVAQNRPLQETQTAVVDLLESLLPGVQVQVVAVQPGGWVSVYSGGRPVDHLRRLLPAPDSAQWNVPWVRLKPPVGDGRPDPPGPRYRCGAVAGRGWGPARFGDHGGSRAGRNRADGSYGAREPA